MTFDHAVVNVMGRMDEAAERYRRLGFTLTPRGYHTLGSINHLAVFADTYLELLGYAPGERAKRAEMWEHPAGLTGLALRTGDAAALHADLQRRGVPVEPCKDFSRPVAIDGQERTARFRTFQIDRRAVANGRIFFCQHDTPELIWRRQWQSHANGATGIAGIVVACEAPDQLTGLLAAVPGIAAGGALRAGRTALRLVRPADLPGLLPGAPALPDLAGGVMRMVALDLFTASTRASAAFLEAQGISFASDAGGLTLSPKTALGLVLRFVPEA